METLQSIKNAVLENKKIIVNTLNFCSYRNYNTQTIEYSMYDEYKPEKWEKWTDKKKYIKAIMQRVHYYNKKGLFHLTKIN